MGIYPVRGLEEPRPARRILRGGVETWMWSVVRGVGV